MTLALDHTPAVAATTERDRNLNMVFTTALEGGIGYWSRAERYFWSVTVDGERTEARDFIAVIASVDEPRKRLVIDRDVIARGIRKAHEKRGWSDYVAQALSDLNWGHYDEADYDADVADIVVQMGLFGEVVYG